MISLFKKILTFFRKLFRNNPNQLADNIINTHQKESFESLKQKEQLLEKRETKLRDGFDKIREYRDWLVSLNNKYEDEKNLMREKIDLVEKEAAHLQTLIEQYKFEIRSVNEKNDHIQTELNKQKEIIQQLLEAKSNEGRTIDPINRSGRIRIPEPVESSIGELGEDKVSKYRPKIVCWKDEWIWEIGVELPDELIDSPDVTITQNDVPLIKDERRGNCFKLNLISGRIQIDTPDNNISDLELDNEGYLLFKLNAGNLNEGILVKRTSKGNYLAVVPNDWQFDESISGPQIAGAEQTSLKNYSAHHYVITKENESKIGFITNNNESYIVESLRQFYSLQGNILEDSGGRQGPLFGERLPTLQINDRNQWENIDCIIVGEEGEDRENWRKKIKTSPEQVSLELSDYLSNINSGWFFIRFYDANLQLVDSCDFRFVSSLLKVKYNNLNLIPWEGGHTDAENELTHTPDFYLKSHSYKSDGIDVITLSSKETKIIVKPKPSIDKLEFDVMSKGGRNVKLFIPVERIWWSENEVASPGTWEDKPINLTPNDFLNLNKSVFIKFPAHGWVSSMRFGFQNRELRSYPVRSDSNFIRIPLSDFSDSEYEMTSFGKHLLFCEVIQNGTLIKFNPFKVVVNANCKFCTKFESTSIDNIVNHIIESHFDLVYVEPSYDDIQPLLPHLPKRIYQCIFCPENHPTYVESFSHNPVEEIIRHIDLEHPGVRHAFRVLNDLEEIKKIISVEIPSYKKCKMCKKPIPEFDWTKHLLISMHENDIILRS